MKKSFFCLNLFFYVLLLFCHQVFFYWHMSKVLRLFCFYFVSVSTSFINRGLDTMLHVTTSKKATNQTRKLIFKDTKRFFYIHLFVHVSCVWVCLTNFRSSSSLVFGDEILDTFWFARFLTMFVLFSKICSPEAKNDVEWNKHRYMLKHMHTNSMAYILLLFTF